MISKDIKRFSCKEKGPAILLGLFKDEGMAEGIFELVKKGTDRPFELLTYETDDWDRDFSIWPADSYDGSRYAGGGKDSLASLKGMVEQIDSERIYIAGYSLAGLFSLWSLYESDMFDGCACCSGSLWYEGFEEYIRNSHVRKQALIYLSLGGKEEKTSNPVMSTIGVKTRTINDLMDRDPLIRKHVLRMNPGGHFGSIDKRIAQGIVWLIENQ